MWISRKEYNKLKEAKADNEVLHADLDLWQAKYTALEEGKCSILHNASGDIIYVITGRDLERMKEEGRRAIEALEVVEPELQKYKKMYADEVQKRLDLLKYITEVRINSDEIHTSQTDS